MASGRNFGEFSDGIWILDSPNDPAADIEAHIASLIEKLEGKESVLAHFRQNGFRTDFFVGILGLEGSDAFRLSDSLVAKVASLGLAIEFDIYAGG